VNIAYTPEFREAMDFFRAVTRSGELSERVLALSKRIISLNAANYTAWHIRRECLFKMRKDLWEEMDFVEECAENNPKNYQIWYHRRALVEHLNDGSREPRFVSQILNNTDAKNYHAWAHRQWAVNRFQLWEGELEFSDYFIKQDVRNNSAWSHRWFVLSRGNTAKILDDRIAAREISYAQEKAELAPSNECPYSYIRALCSKSKQSLGDDQIAHWLQSLLSKCGDGALYHLRAMLVDSWILRGRREEAMNGCIELGERYDSIRASYWKWRAARIASRAD